MDGNVERLSLHPALGQPVQDLATKGSLLWPTSASWMTYDIEFLTTAAS